MSRTAQPFTVALVQMRCSADPDDNVRRASEALHEAARRGAQVACLPELFRTHYFCQVEDPSRFDLAESIPGPTSERLSAVARATRMVVVGSIFERRAAGVYHNTAVVLDADGSIRGLYRKMHIPDDPLYYEKYYFTPGDLGFQAIETSVARVGTLVCWDQWYPEAARLTALKGAEVLFYPTAIGWHPAEKAEYGEAQSSAWETVQRAHAISNGVYVAAVNRVGHEGPADGGLEFWGGSFVADPFGRVLARAGRDSEEILTVTCDPQIQEETRRHWPFLRDRRIDAYGPITQRFLDPDLMTGSSPETGTPAQLGYRMPAEWEPHEATWIAWPQNRDDWPGKFGPIRWVYAEIVRHLSRVERVNIVVQGEARRKKAADCLDRAGADLDRITFVEAASDRVWLRDSGPTFVVNGQSRGVGLIDWRFNGWAKYENHRRDNRLPRRLARRLNLRRWVPRVEIDGKPTRVVLEGGAIDVNGRGTLLTTEECLLSDIQARNPGLGREAIERVLADFLDARHVIWLGQGIAGDDTHGHVDDLARFVDPRTIVTVVEPRESDPNFEALQDNWRRLRAARDQDGDPIRVVALPMPAPVVFEGQRLPASYANFYIANGLVLVPTFNDPADREALSTLATLFPDREVVGIHAVDLVWGLGTLHCLSQQQPA